MARTAHGPLTSILSSEPDVVCLSHLRWNFVFQRPQHLLSRIAERRRVFFVEEPVPTDEASRLDLRMSPEGVIVAVPHLARADFENPHRRTVGSPGTELEFAL